MKSWGPVRAVPPKFSVGKQSTLMAIIQLRGRQPASQLANI